MRSSRIIAVAAPRRAVVAEPQRGRVPASWVLSPEVREAMERSVAFGDFSGYIARRNAGEVSPPEPGPHPGWRFFCRKPRRES